MRFATVVACVLSVFLAACGNESEPGSPASVVPEASAVYATVTLDPEGDQEEAVQAIAERFPGGEDLDRQIARGLSQALKEEGLNYGDDVEPWLGDEAAAFITGISGEEEEPDGAVVLATTDEEAARDAIAKVAPRGARERSYKGTDYTVADGAATAMVDGNVVAGSEPGVRAAIDTADGGESIEGSEEVEQAFEPLPDERLIAVYIDGARLLRGLPSAAAQLGPIADLLGEPYAVALTAEPDAVVLDSTVPATLTGPLVPLLAGTGSDAIEELPADAWFATAAPDVGGSVRELIRLFAGASGSGGVDQAEAQLREATGLDFEGAFGWMGDLAGYVGGTTLAELGGGVIVQSTDAAASRRALAAFGRLARREASSGSVGERVGPVTLPGGGDGFTLRSSDVPQPIHVVQRGERVAVAYGDDATQALLEPGDTLADAEDFQGAGDRLGEGFIVGSYLDVEPVIELAKGLGATDSGEYQEAEPYLEPFSGIVAGTREDEGAQLSRTRVELD